MLIRLGTGLRFRLAIAFAAFAAFCFVLPPAVLAFGHGANTIACLSHADAVNHGNAHDHGPADQEGGTPSEGHHANCCGLFCLSALPVGGEALAPAPAGGSYVLPLNILLPGGVPERLDRPPISLVFV
ncbi:MAG: hypothetical protein ACRECX_11400 [Methyloceanibacter sp.]|uniref:hypothetical protein n=1 Tax=Methyloceanibacter sp. TaxID=1965321 RepID=UPI003D6C8D20